MRKRPVKILDHPPDLLILRVLFQQGFITPSHALRHSALTHITSGDHAAFSKMGLHTAQDLRKICFGTAKAGRPEQKYIPSVQLLHTFSDISAAVPFIRPEAKEDHICVFHFLFYII